jgi:hypothetical protein
MKYYEVRYGTSSTKVRENHCIYLFNYFFDIKNQVDLLFSNKHKRAVKKEKHIKIVDTIKIFERNSYKQIEPFNAFENQIELI